jgi:hypothetical protein
MYLKYNSAGCEIILPTIYIGKIYFDLSVDSLDPGLRQNFLNKKFYSTHHLKRLFCNSSKIKAASFLGPE